MQIVIDIPEEMYDWYDNGFPEEDDAEKLWQIVKNGTPLEEKLHREKEQAYYLGYEDGRKSGWTAAESEPQERSE